MAKWRDTKAYVRQPRAMGPPVGKKLAFLEQYHPHHTVNLPPGLNHKQAIEYMVLDPAH